MNTRSKIPAILAILLMPVFWAMPAVAAKGPCKAIWGADRQLTVNLFSIGSGNTETYNDGFLVRYNNGYLLSTADDAEMITKSGESIASYRESLDLSEEKRPFFSASDTIFMHITNTSVGNYRFKINMQNFSVTGLVVRLYDNYLHTSRVLDTYGGTDNIDFSVTADAASADPFRFIIVFITARSLPVTITDFTAKQTGKNIALQWKVSNQVNIFQYEVERSYNGINFSRVAVQAAAATGGSQAYNWVDEQAATGTLNIFYRIRCTGIGGEIGYSTVIHIKLGNATGDISIYPNPVTNNTLVLLFTDMEKGTYGLRLLNSNGQVLLTRSVNYTGSSQTVTLGRHIAKGNYYLEISGVDVKIVKMVAMEE